MFKAYRPEIELALHAVSQAAMLCRQIQHEAPNSGFSKRDRSPVTVADFASQAVVSFLLQQGFPDDTLVAEEDSAALRDRDREAVLLTVTDYVARLAPQATPQEVCAWIDRGAGEPAPRFWVLDPLDGTKGFLRRAQYAVALALIEDGRVVVGALGCPNLDLPRAHISGVGTVVVAARGQGAWATGLEVGDLVPLRVSAVEDPREARLLRSVESDHTDERKLSMLIDHLGIRPSPILMDSQAKCAVLAAGEADLLFRLLPAPAPQYRELLWDQAAGSIVVEEAGGATTDLCGQPLDFGSGRTLVHNLGVVVSNGRLHEAALLAARRVGADRP